MDGKNHHNSVIIFQLKLINFKMNKNKQIPWLEQKAQESEMAH